MVQDLQVPKEGSQPLHFDAPHSRGIVQQCRWLLWKVSVAPVLQAQQPRLPCIHCAARELVCALLLLPPICQAASLRSPQLFSMSFSCAPGTGLDETGCSRRTTSPTGGCLPTMACVSSSPVSSACWCASASAADDVNLCRPDWLTLRAHAGGGHLLAAG